MILEGRMFMHSLLMVNAVEAVQSAARESLHIK